MKVVIAGAWNGYGHIAGPNVNPEENQEITVETGQHDVHVRTGCRDNWMSFPTAAKMGITLMQAAAAGQAKVSRHAFELTPKKDGAEARCIVGAFAAEVYGDNITFYDVDGKHLCGPYTMSRYTMRVIPNPDYEALTSVEGAGQASAQSVVNIIQRMIKNSSNFQDFKDWFNGYYAVQE